MPNKARQNVGQVPEYLTRAISESLEPLVRLCIARGITFAVLDELIRTLYVEIASREFVLADKSQTQSRISVVTGLHRREVKRLSERHASREVSVESATRGGELVSKWISTRPYIDERGRPLPLARTISQGGRRSFEALVASFSKDIRARAILDEWLRLGVVTLDAEDRVHLNVDSFVAPKGQAEQAFYFGQNVGDHVAAAVANLLGANPTFPDRSVWRDELSPQSVERLSRMAERLTMRVVARVNRQAEQLELADKKAETATHRVNFGFYIYSAPMSDATTAAPVAGKSKRRSRRSR